MDSSISAAQNMQPAQTSDQPENNTQAPSGISLSQNSQQSASQAQSASSVPQATQQKTQISVGNVEEGATAIIAESPDADEDDEDELQVAPQETKNSVIGQGAMAGIDDEIVEIRPSVPEFAASSPEVEKIIEKTPDQEKPVIPQEVKDMGVTHSGPGVIDIQQNTFGITKLPVPFEVAATQEKTTKLHDSKHWLMGMIMYIWRKVNPKLGTKEGMTK